MGKNETSGMNRLVRVIIWLLIVLLFAGTIGIIWKYTDGGNEDFATFYLSYDGKDIIGSGIVRVAGGSNARFQVKQVSGKVEEGGYSVAVLTNAQNAADRFSYTVDDKEYSFRSGTDVTAVFGVECDGDSFTISVPASMEDVIKALYRSEQVGSREQEAKDVAYFRLVVTSAKQEAVQVDLKIANFGMFTSYPSGRFALDKTDIEF